MQTGTTISLPENTLVILSPHISSMYFDFNQQLEQRDHISLLAWVHVHSEVHKTDLAQTMDIWQRLIANQPQETLSVVAQSLANPADLGKGNLETLTIKRSYESLCRIVRREEKDNLRLWYLAYRDIVSKYYIDLYTVRLYL